MFFVYLLLIAKCMYICVVYIPVQDANCVHYKGSSVLFTYLYMKLCTLLGVQCIVYTPAHDAVYATRVPVYCLHTCT